MAGNMHEESVKNILWYVLREVICRSDKNHNLNLKQMDILLKRFPELWFQFVTVAVCSCRLLQMISRDHNEPQFILI